MILCIWKSHEDEKLRVVNKVIATPKVVPTLSFELNNLDYQEV